MQPKYKPLILFRLKAIILYGFFHHFVSTNTFSRWVGTMADNDKIPRWFLKWIIRLYIRFYRINMDDFDIDPDKVETFNAFFTRKLKKGVRTWEDGICSPVDGRILTCGSFSDGMLHQIKGMNYSQNDLIAQPPLKEGSFVTIYLAPGDYHRVHAPFDMEIEEIRHIPGKLLSVSLMNVMHIKQLYNQLERVILSGTNKYGKFHFVFVGAYNVGSIRLSFDPRFKTNRSSLPLSRPVRKQEKIRKSEEIGFFELGSTVVILTESDVFSKCRDKLLFQTVKLGQRISW